MKLDAGRIEVIDDRVAAALRAIAPGDRLQTALDMWDHARDLARGGVRRRHPDWSDSQVEREVARRMSGESV